MAKLKLKDLFARIFGQCEFKTLLWENPDPTIQFAAQTIPCNLSGYDAVEIIYRNPQSGSQSTGMIDKDFTVGMDITCNTNGYRLASCHDNGVEFSNAKEYSAYGGASTSNCNGQAIPVAIYGIKFAGGGIS